MDLACPITNSPVNLVHRGPLYRSHFKSSPCSNLLTPNISLSCESPNLIEPKSVSTTHFKIKQQAVENLGLGDASSDDGAPIPTMSDIMESSKAQNLDLQLQTLGPFFRVTAKNRETQRELGRADGLIRVWLEGRILHLDSIRLSSETLRMKRSIFGIGLFIGAVAIRHGYDCGCRKAELLAINDTDLYHSKLVKYYTRVGFKAVYEVRGSSVADMAHMLIWGGVGTRMDAGVEHLLRRWCARFRPTTTSTTHLLN